MATAGLAPNLPQDLPSSMTPLRPHSAEDSQPQGNGRREAGSLNDYMAWTLPAPARPPRRPTLGCGVNKK